MNVALIVVAYQALTPCGRFDNSLYSGCGTNRDSVTDVSKNTPARAQLHAMVLIAHDDVCRSTSQSQK
jgi:hypothetical protein